MVQQPIYAGCPVQRMCNRMGPPNPFADTQLFMYFTISGNYEWIKSEICELFYGWGTADREEDLLFGTGLFTFHMKAFFRIFWWKQALLFGTINFGSWYNEVYLIRILNLVQLMLDQIFNRLEKKWSKQTNEKWRITNNDVENHQMYSYQYRVFRLDWMFKNYWKSNNNHQMIEIKIIELVPMNTFI